MCVIPFWFVFMGDKAYNCSSLLLLCFVIIRFCYSEMQNHDSKADVEWRKKASWTEQEHRSVSSTVLEDNMNNQI